MNILITGANRGLGLSLTTVFLERGHTVFACARNIDTAGKLHELDRIFKGTLKIIPMDVQDPVSVIHAYECIAETTKDLDILINNAAREGVVCKDIQNIDIDDLTTTLETNLLGTILVTKTFLQLMQQSEHKVIVNITSEAGSISRIPLGTYGYSISKASVNMFTQLLSRQLQKLNFKIMALHPGWMKTDMGGPDAPLHPDDVARHIFTRINTTNSQSANHTFVDYLGNAMPF